MEVVLLPNGICSPDICFPSEFIGPKVNGVCQFDGKNHILPNIQHIITFSKYLWNQWFNAGYILLSLSGKLFGF